jgi:hypothetical protein
MRVDARRMMVPLLPLAEQQRSGAAFRHLRDFTAAASEFADLANEPARSLGAFLVKRDVTSVSRATEVNYANLLSMVRVVHRAVISGYDTH